MSEFEWVKPNPDVRIRRVQFNGIYEDLPAEARASGKLELNEFGWVIVHTPRGPERLNPLDYLQIGSADDWYPVPPAVSEYRWLADGDGAS